MGTAFREILITLIIALLIFGAVRVSVHSYKVSGESMEPSFDNGEYLLVNKASYHLHSPQRGDVIVFHNPVNPSQLFIKRVIGLPGEQLRIEDGKIYIAGGDGEFKLLEEPEYIPSMFYNYGPIEIPPGEYFVLGDNRNNSSDSHTGWTVPRDNIIGKTWISYWPPDDWGLSPGYSWALE